MPVVYCYEHTDKGKVSLLRTDSSEPGKFTCQELLIYDFDKFPGAMPCGHINFGTWNPLATDRRSRQDPGIAFVNALPGKGTTMSDMPHNGTAIYVDPGCVIVRKAAPEGDFVASAAFLLSAETTVDFGKNTIDLALDWPVDGSDAVFGFTGFKGKIDGYNLGNHGFRGCTRLGFGEGLNKSVTL